MWPVKDAADQSRAEAAENPHQPQGFQPHVLQVLVAAVALVQPGHRLDFVADFRVAGQIGRLDPALADPAGSLLFRLVVLGLLAAVHQTSGFVSDLTAKFRIGHLSSAKALGV